MFLLFIFFLICTLFCSFFILLFSPIQVLGFPYFVPFLIDKIPYFVPFKIKKSPLYVLVWNKRCSNLEQRFLTLKNNVIY